MPTSTSDRLLATLLALGGLPVSASAQQDAEATSPASVTEEIAALARPHEAAGLLSGVVLVARGRQVLYREAWGHADWELRQPNDASMRFGIGSITKPMTEILARLLAREGKLDLDAPVDTYLGRFPLGPDGGRPTVRHLLEHRSGVPHRVTEPREEDQVLLAADIVERIRETGLLFEPGSQRLYSSAGYTALARIIELVAGQPFHEVLAEKVFEPAGMAAAIGETGRGLMPRRAVPHVLGVEAGHLAVKAAPNKDLRFLTGAGSVYATAEDLLRFVLAVRDRVFGGDIAEEAFGVEPGQWVALAGRTNGYEASVDVLPTVDLTVVFLSNLQSATNWQLRERIVSLLDGRSAEPIPLPPAVATRFEDPAELTGTFGPAEITVEAGRLFRGENEFYPVVGGRYYIPASGTFMRFRRDVSGRVDAILSTSGNGRETVLLRSGGGTGGDPRGGD